jgi:prolyl 4-hydroxylase
MQHIWKGKIEQVSWKPRAYVLHSFLSDAEADHIVDLARANLHKSSVVDSDTGGSVDSNVRTSSGTFLGYRQTDVIERIEKRIATITMLPEPNQEAMQVLRYVDGQKYEPHTDSFHDPFNTDPTHGGQRYATLLMYLSTPEEGGETVFPYADSKVSGPGWSDCALQGLSVKAIKGNAVLFFSLHPDGSEDIASTHGSCPTLKGEKWSAPKWIHLGAVQGERDAKTNCEDGHASCPMWAIQQECEKNPLFMWDTCRKSCKRCDVKGAKALLCRRIGGNSS